MITLITGGSGSGKSAYAEKYICYVSNEKGYKEKYYIATMQVFDDEGQRKIDRHRRLRAGKGFITVEQPRDIQNAVSKLQSENCLKNGRSALLECMSNLTANEMFTKDGMKSEEEVVEKIVSEIQTLSQKLDNLVIVTNNVFEDGVIYDAGTMEYLRALGRINAVLAHLADRVAEVVVGIPVELKG